MPDLLTHQHACRLAFHIDEGFAADVDGDPIDRAAREAIGRSRRGSRS